MKNKALFKLLRVFISVSLIAFLLSIANLTELWEALKSASIWFLLIALVLAFSRVFISAFRWRIMLSPKGMRVPFVSLTSFYFVGSFFNMFLPTVLGGDVVRGYELARYSRRAVDSAATVLMERIIGFLALFLICWISLLIGFQKLEGTNILVFIGVMSFAFIVTLVVLFNARLMQRILSLTRIIKRWNVEGRLKETFNSVHAFARARGVMFKAFVVSLVFQFVGIISTYVISEALGLGVPLVYFLMVMPIIWVIMMVPISIAGLGVREGAFVLFFTQQGVSTENALLLSLLFFGLTVVIALVGGIIFLWGGYRRRKFQSGKEQEI